MLNKKIYQNLLKELLDRGYSFESFNKRDVDTKLVLLRHDIDVNLNYAYSMAKIERDLGIKATYFLMIRSPAYNLFSKNNSRIVEQLINMGHEIGLHFDSSSFINDDVELHRALKREVDTLNIMFDIDVSVVSFHQPCQSVLNNEIKINKINTYDRDDMEGIFYISDSNANLRILDIETITMNNKIQMLIHPIWWANEKFISTEESWNCAIINNFENEEKQILETERAYGNKRCIKIY